MGREKTIGEKNKWVHKYNFAGGHIQENEVICEYQPLHKTFPLTPQPPQPHVMILY